MLTCAKHGPTLSTVSRAAVKMAVSILSKLEGMVMIPVDFPPFESILT